MPARALIIAIQNYSDLTEMLSGGLAGTHNGATSFYEWLISSKKLDPANIFFCTEDPSLPGCTAAARRDDIKEAIVTLAKAGKDTTPELFVYFSGHGFFFTDTGGRVTSNVLVAADFKARNISGDKCINLDQLQKELRLGLGKGDHYYFIDACRNEIAARDVDVASLGLRQVGS